MSEADKAQKMDPNEEETIFHKIVAGKIPSTKVYENDDVYSFRDINPVAKVHIIIVPKKMQGLNMLSSAKPEHVPILGKYSLQLILLNKKNWIRDIELLLIVIKKDANLFHIYICILLEDNNLDGHQVFKLKN